MWPITDSGPNHRAYWQPNYRSRAACYASTRLLTGAYGQTEFNHSRLDCCKPEDDMCGLFAGSRAGLSSCKDCSVCYVSNSLSCEMHIQTFIKWCLACNLIISHDEILEFIYSHLLRVWVHLECLATRTMVFPTCLCLFVVKDSWNDEGIMMCVFLQVQSNWRGYIGGLACIYTITVYFLAIYLFMPVWEVYFACMTFNIEKCFQLRPET